MVGPPSVRIEHEPLLTLVFSAVEVYNRECLGYLFGRKPNKNRQYYTVTSAISCSAVVRRTNAEVRQGERAYRRLLHLIKSAPQLYSCIGDFHSHPATTKYRRPFGLSVGDMKSMVAGNEEFCILVTISRRGKRRLDWRLKARRTRLRGSIAGFDVHIMAYRLVCSSDGKPLKDTGDLPQAERLPLLIARSTIQALNRAKP